MNLSNKQKTRRRRSKTPVINTSMDRDSDSDASLSPEELREKYLAAAADIGRQYALRCCPWMPKVFAHKLEHGRPTMDPEDPAQRFINEKTETTARLVQAWLFLAGNKYVRRQLGYDAEIATRVRNLQYSYVVTVPLTYSFSLQRALTRRSANSLIPPSTTSL